jgi:hypothetical protein
MSVKNSMRLQRVLAEKNYNQAYENNYADYGYKSESDMLIKEAQLIALYKYGMSKTAGKYAMQKNAFVVPMVSAGLKAAKGAIVSNAPKAWEAVKAGGKALGKGYTAGEAKAVGAALNNSTTATAGQKFMGGVKGMAGTAGTYAKDVGQRAGTAAKDAFKANVVDPTANIYNKAGGGMAGAKAVGSAVYNNPYGQSAIIGGGLNAAMAGLSPVQEGETRLGNMARGAASGATSGLLFTGAQRGLSKAQATYGNPAT